MITKTIKTSALGTTIGGYGGSVSIYSDIADIKGDYYVIPVSAGAIDFQFVGAIATVSVDQHNIYVSAARADSFEIKVYVFYK